MKTLPLLAATAGLLLLCAAVARAADNSQGVYRIPYQTGTQVLVTEDHLTHSPSNRIDLRGVSGTGTYRVVAAADGVIRFIVDSNTITCTTNGCANYNNYVWIEHPNGEWTKYSHLRTGTTTGAAGLKVGQHVCAGTYLGDEGAVGQATGQHLHFEVAIPDDSANPIEEKGGFIKGVNLVPRICAIDGGTLVAGQTYTAEACDKVRLSSGLYRIPFADGTQVRVSGDHINHAAVPNRIDMSGTGSRGTYTIVAAADGVIRAIMETNTITCTTNGCTKYNNYVWIEHPNGEWTKYSHMQTGTTTALGRFVGEKVCAGTPLGIEDDVGAASGKHLHWEVGVPTDPTDAFSVSGGFLKGVNRIPMICGIPGNIFAAGQTYTAGPCDAGDCVPDLLLPAQSIHDTAVFMAADEIDSGNQTVTIASCGTVTMRAGNRITFRPGFRSRSGSWLRASIKDCNEMQRLAECRPLILGAGSSTSTSTSTSTSISPADETH